MPETEVVEEDLGNPGGIPGRLQLRFSNEIEVGITDATVGPFRNAAFYSGALYIRGDSVAFWDSDASVWRITNGVPLGDAALTGQSFRIITAQ